MQVGAVAVLERAPFFDAAGRFRLDDVRALVASRLQLIPRFRKRVMPVPFGRGRPVWVDDDAVRHRATRAAHPPPGARHAPATRGARRTAHGPGARPCAPVVGALVRRRCRPREHVGLIHKSHHSLTDGISGVDIATVLLDFTAEPTVLEPDDWTGSAAARPGSTRRRHGARPRGPARRRRRRGAPGHRRTSGGGRPHGRAGPVDRLARRPQRRGAAGVVQRHRRSRAADRDGEGAPRHGARRARRVRVHGQRRHPRDRGGSGGARARGSRRAAARARAQGVLPGVGACRRATMQLGNRISAMLVPLAVGEPDARVRIEAVRGSHRRSEGATSGGGGRRAARPHRVRGAHAARARRARARTRSGSPTSSSPTCPVRRCRCTASARGWSRSIRSSRCRGTSRSMSPSSRTAVSCTSASWATARRRAISRSSPVASRTRSPNWESSPRARSSVGVVSVSERRMVQA